MKNTFRSEILSVIAALLFVLSGEFIHATEPAITVHSSTNAAFAEHLAQLKVPEGFTVVVQPPFVVIGDKPPAQVRLRATNTVKWAVDRLKQD